MCCSQLLILFYRYSPPVNLINPRYLIVQKTGEVNWYRRFKINTACDAQEKGGPILCPVQIGSFQFSTNEQTFSSINCFSDIIHIPEIIVTSYNTSNNNSSDNVTVVSQEVERTFVVINNMNITDFYSKKEELMVQEIPFDKNSVTQAVCVLKFDEIVPKKTNHSEQSSHMTSNGPKALQTISFLIYTLIVYLTLV